MLQQDVLNSITEAIAIEVFPLLRHIVEREGKMHSGGDESTKTAIGQAVIDLTASALTWSLCKSEEPPEQPNLSPDELTPEDAREAVKAAIETWEHCERLDAGIAQQLAELELDVTAYIQPDTEQTAEGDIVDNVHNIEAAPQTASESPVPDESHWKRTERLISERLANKVVPAVYEVIQETAAELADDDIFECDRLANTVILELVEYLSLAPLNVEFPFYTTIHIARLGSPRHAAEWFNVPVESGDKRVW